MRFVYQDLQDAKGASRCEIATSIDCLADFSATRPPHPAPVATNRLRKRASCTKICKMQKVRVAIQRPSKNGFSLDIALVLDLIFQQEMSNVWLQLPCLD